MQPLDDLVARADFEGAAVLGPRLVCADLGRRDASLSGLCADHGNQKGRRGGGGEKGLTHCALQLAGYFSTISKASPRTRAFAEHLLSLTSPASSSGFAAKVINATLAEVRATE